jgi:Family of unknown function (DUF6580)
VNDRHLHTLRDALIFALLVGIGVAGRWAQPEWCFTPTAAVAVFAGFYFSRATIAALVPVAVLAISDLVLPAYDSLAVMVATYAVMTVPVLFGKWLRGRHSGKSTAWRWAACGLLPAVLFFVVTNFAVWAFQSDYPKTPAGLLACYWAAVPFFRWMVAGDVIYLAAIFGCWALADVRLPGVDRVPQRILRMPNERS